MSITVNRKPIIFSPDPKRIVARFRSPGSKLRQKELIKEILKMPEDQVRDLLGVTLKNFSRRHRNITTVFKKHFAMIDLKRIGYDPIKFTSNQILLIGAYFTMEYSIEAAAFFNPSIVEDPNQIHLKPGNKRVILSFRATGEGHISSIVFRSGVLDKNLDIHFSEPSSFVDFPEQIQRHVFSKEAFFQKLDEMNINHNIASLVMDKLGDKFIYGELQASIANCMSNKRITREKKKVIQTISWLAESHYEITFSMDTSLSERVIFPTSYKERNGIEDARFVRFVDDNGQVTYYATYTAFDGEDILPKLLETKDFYHFKITPLNGKYAINKGLALFPRKIKGKYAMISRVDGENHYIMYSDNIRLWQQREKFQEPKYSWELVQIGSGGSPIELPEGWLLITHGVGPMRTYCLSAVLLDRDNPKKIIGRLKEPLIYPNQKEREGYVPNVVYSCGSMIHNGHLVIPYAMSDYASTYATIPLDELVAELKSGV